MRTAIYANKLSFAPKEKPALRAVEQEDRLCKERLKKELHKIVEELIKRE